MFEQKRFLMQSSQLLLIKDPGTKIKQLMSAYIANTSHDSAWGTVICNNGNTKLRDSQTSKTRA